MTKPDFPKGGKKEQVCLLTLHGERKKKLFCVCWATKFPSPVLLFILHRRARLPKREQHAFAEEGGEGEGERFLHPKGGRTRGRKEKRQKGTRFNL